MKKQILKNLTEEMIEILLIDLQEENATENSQTIRFKHYNKDLVAKIIAAARPKYSLEWSTDIIRDEVYATIYESMEIIAADLAIEEIRLDNKAFAGPVYNMTMIKLKDKLIPASKQGNKEQIAIFEIAASQLGTDENGQPLTIEEILAAKEIDILMGSKEKKMNQFINWFNNNKTDILTKRQIDFLKGEVHHKDPDKARTMRKRIADRVSKAYSSQYGEVSPRIANLMDQQYMLETILDAKDFRTTLNKYLDDDTIIDALTSHISLKTMKAYNQGSTDPAIIKEYRIALFKKLGEVISMIEANK